jgi:hypothetical protein
MQLFIWVLFSLIDILSVQGICQDGKSIEYSRFPRVVKADVPLYPPVAATMRFGGTIKFFVTVKDGIIEDIQLKQGIIEPSSNSKITVSDKLLTFLVEPSIENLKTWRFVLEEQGSFTITFVYEMEGEEILFPENPKIELELPVSVKITAKPFKPTQMP